LTNALLTVWTGVEGELERAIPYQKGPACQLNEEQYDFVARNRQIQGDDGVEHYSGTSDHRSYEESNHVDDQRLVGAHHVPLKELPLTIALRHKRKMETLGTHFRELTV
jgi:hypothetical protein